MAITKLRLGKGSSFVKSRLRNYQQEDDVWEADFQPIPDEEHVEFWLGMVVALVAIYQRDAGGTGVGQLVDTAIYESVFNVMESLLPEYDRFGHVRERSGAKLEAPRSTDSQVWASR